MKKYRILNEKNLIAIIEAGVFDVEDNCIFFYDEYGNKIASTSINNTIIMEEK